MHKDTPKIMVGTAAIFLLSLSLYNRRRFRVDQDVLKFTFFGIASSFSAYSWANFIFSSADVEAAVMNNEREGGRV
eukprot:CAMPEP_0197000688 /NCGR_PEP_ID=MMETSP1380-20130617/5564_1 /TAXON_ID=5936 /ORGANISM="Euplotes crassus, Strain CT5" /LENGTH=75 /DNA_ID=CAMNT_0042418067 /DNA_START=66 /DNA_END=293 /DNA_ORIENTATION=+